MFCLVLQINCEIFQNSNRRKLKVSKKKVQEYRHFENEVSTWQQKFLNLYLLFRHLLHWGNVIGEFREPILHNKGMMGLYAQNCVIS